MPAHDRSLPAQPSLRFLKLEAKRRLAAGEFPALHDAQLAIAREHGFPSWTQLRRAVLERGGDDSNGDDSNGDDADAPDSPALAQLSWVIDRFRDAGSPGWSAPGEAEVRDHVGEPLLIEFPPERLVETISAFAPVLRQDARPLRREPLAASVQVADLRIDATVDAAPPHLLTALRARPATRPSADPRLRRAAGPPTAASGAVPAPVAEAAAAVFGELGLAGLVLAGAEAGGPGAQPWVQTVGWADLERDEPLTPAHRLPAPGVTALVTATAVLRLVADGRVGLDDPANRHLRALRLADDTVTVRELLTHTGGLAEPDPAALYGEGVPELADLLGPEVAVRADRGSIRPSNAGIAVLGQVLADVTGAPYAEAAGTLVLEPLRMASAGFPATPAEVGPGAVTTYVLTAGDDLAPAPAQVCAIPAAGGLWASAGDLMRLATGWPSLLPAALARAALTPDGASGAGGQRHGLGWLISPGGDLALHAGAGGGATAALVRRSGDGRVLLAVTSRLTPLDPVLARIGAAWPDR